MQFSICTLGCKTNQFESQAMAKILTERGHTQVLEGQPVDAYLINTCSVTAVSDKKSRQTIRNIRKKHPHALVAVCGCYAQLEPEELSKLEIDLLAGTAEKEAFLTQLEALYQKRTALPQGIADFFSPPEALPQDNPFQRKTLEVLPSGGLEGRTRALLKIQDGCNLFCSYCIIPYARGRIRSLTLEDSAQAFQDLIHQGFQEIVLTGIEISAWGKDLPNQPPFQDFLQQADEICAKSQVYLRLGSLEPRTITEEFCSIAKNCTSLRPHFHLSMQSGCDTVLQRMNRKYDSQRFYQSVSFLRDHFQAPAITTDMIVGFPQETQEEHTQSLAFIQKCQFASMHIFPYSPRNGTPAAKMEGQITKEVKEQRAKEASALATEMTLHYNKQFLGNTIPVLFETKKEDNLWMGHTPEHISVLVPSDTPLQNQTHLVTIEAQHKTGFVGVLA